MVEVGDKGIVFGVGGPNPSFVPVPPAQVGDKVALYNLENGDRIAVPILNLELGGQAWITPSFDFAGFDFKIDFDFLLIPLDFGAGYYTIRHLTDLAMQDDVRGDWTVHELIGKYVYIVAGVNAGESYLILDNGTNWITIDRTYTDGWYNGEFNIGVDGLDGWNPYAAPTHWHANNGILSIDNIGEPPGDTLHASISHAPPGNGIPFSFKYRELYYSGTWSIYIYNGNILRYLDAHSFPVDEDGWSIVNYTFPGVSTSFYIAVTHSGGDLPLFTEFKEFSSNRVYNTLIQMGFGIGNLFRIVDTVP